MLLLNSDKFSKILIGIHGAGFTNMVYMKTKSKVIDILPLSYSTPQTKEIEISANIINVHQYKIIVKDTVSSFKKFEVGGKTLNNLVKTPIKDT